MQLDGDCGDRVDPGRTVGKDVALGTFDVYREQVQVVDRVTSAELQVSVCTIERPMSRSTDEGLGTSACECTCDSDVLESGVGGVEGGIHAQGVVGWCRAGE